MTEPTEPTEPTEATGPTEPTEPAEPAEPTGSAAPAAPTTSYHLRPRSGWLNDPNGMVLRDGVWHVFFQHNPDAPVHRQIAWGHATSRDLAGWEPQPLAFAPSPGAPDSFGCWSGVFVPGHERPAVAYSGIADSSYQSTVCLRWGSPDLRDWGPPVVVGRTPRADGVAIMRDPFVLEHGGRRLAVLGAGLDDGTPAVLLFDRSDELAWRYEGILVADDPLLRAAGEADIWECPQLFPLGGRWVLIVSLQADRVLGAVAVAVGDLVEDAGRLRFVSQRVHLADEGTSLYAPQVVADAAHSGPGPGGWWPGSAPPAGHATTPGAPGPGPGRHPRAAAGSGQAPLPRHDAVPLGSEAAGGPGEPLPRHDAVPARDDEAPLLLGWVRQAEQDPGVRDHAGCLSLPRRLRLVDDVVVSRVDPVAASALAPGQARGLPAGETDLGGRRQVVDVVGEGVRLRHPALGTYDVAPGDQIWVDGAVVELYRASGLPATWRHDEPWTLLVPHDGAARVRDVVLRIP